MSKLAEKLIEELERTSYHQDKRKSEQCAMIPVQDVIDMIKKYDTNETIHIAPKEVEALAPLYNINNIDISDINYLAKLRGLK